MTKHAECQKCGSTKNLAAYMEDGAVLVECADGCSTPQLGDDWRSREQYFRTFGREQSRGFSRSSR